MPDSFDRAAEILLLGILDRAFPAAVAEVGQKDGPIWRRPFGTLTYDAGASDTTNETVFDLASLTKVIATTTLAMRAVDEGLLTVADPVRNRLSEWRGADREGVTVRDLLAHCSGLPAYLPFFRDHAEQVGMEDRFFRSLDRIPVLHDAHRRQNRDEGNHDQQLDECEPAVAPESFQIRHAGTLPVLVFRSVQARPLGFRVDVVDIAAAPRGRVGLVGIGTKSPIGRVRERIDRNPS